MVLHLLFKENGFHPDIGASFSRGATTQPRGSVLPRIGPISLKARDKPSPDF
jgi:hypothetical protein